MTHLALAKPYMDVGLFTNRGDEMREFYSRAVGLELTDTLDIEEGYRLHRYDARGSALKINALDEPMDRAISGFRRVVFPMAGLAEPKELWDPDGTSVLLVPMGELDVTQLGIVWAVARGGLPGADPPDTLRRCDDVFLHSRSTGQLDRGLAARRPRRRGRRGRGARVGPGRDPRNPTGTLNP